ncbi:hypothetical protein [Pantoea sp. At-9b]|uniref:hypothetical protein n=1 Tax=Pantoea sp. (strain At-9b) TaxID=592316 RepID=UPI0001B40AE9|nr:hypothetical protein [Pantoea sp. At-9b]ADU72090.1 hypothetical protein Pat9b_4756 [Pantoea sp. At-9b]
MNIQLMKTAIVALCLDELEKRELQFGPKLRPCFPSWFPAEWDDGVQYDALCELLEEGVISLVPRGQDFADGFLMKISHR